MAYLDVYYKNTDDQLKKIYYIITLLNFVYLSLYIMYIYILLYIEKKCVLLLYTRL